MVAKGRAIHATQVASAVEIVEMGGFCRGDWGLGMTPTGGGGAYELCVCTDV